MKKINFLYEFITPNGFLPFGYELIDLPIIFSEINDTFDDTFHQTIRLIKEPSFRVTKGISDTYEKVVQYNDVKRVLVTELNQEQLSNENNIFVIDDIQDSDVIEYVSTLNFDNIFTEVTSVLFKKYTSIKLIIVSNVKHHVTNLESFFTNICKFVNTYQITNDKVIFVTNLVNINDVYTEYLQKYNMLPFMKICKNITEI